MQTRTRINRLRTFVSKLHLQYGLAITGAVLGFVTGIYIPARLVQLLFQVVAGQPVSSSVVWVLVICALLRGLFRYMEHYFGHYVAFRVLADFRRVVFQELRRLTPAKLDLQQPGSLLKVIGEDIEALEVFFAHTIPPILTASIVTFGLGVFYVRYHWSLAVIALVTYGVLAVGIPIRFARVLSPLLAEQHKVRAQYIAAFLEDLRGMHELQQFNQVHSHFAALEAQSKVVNRQERAVAQTQTRQTSVSYLTIGLSLGVMALIGVWLVQAQQVALTNMVLVLVVFSSSFAPYLELARLPLGFKRAMNAADTVFALIDEPSTVEQTAGQDAVPIDSVNVTEVGFHYPSRLDPVLQDFNWSVLPTQGSKIVGIMGTSGSGKSTIMKLLMKWYVPQTGEVALSGQPLQQTQARSLQQQVAYIPQVPQVFSQTIRENIQLGRQTITDAQIEAAFRNCQLWDRIAQLPLGLDTPLQQDQALFSSGELQRLELVRALLKGASCYIFDEPTSHLDSLNEAALLQLIREQCQGLVFLISHRPSTMAIVDELYRMHDGQLVPVAISKAAQPE